jgi:hypothetical protein
VGCGDDETTEPGATALSQAEALSIINEAIAVLMAATQSGLSGGPAPAAAAVPFDFTHEHTLACPAGGEISATVSASGDMDQGSGNMTMQGSATYTDCAREGPERTITLNGQLSQSGSMTVVDNVIDASFTLTGSLAWDFEPGDAGSCDFNLTILFSNQSGSVTGTACGHPIDSSG